MFISFEGGDGAGKTTLIKSLHKKLAQQGQVVIETRAPGGTEIGKAIRDVLLSKHASPMNQRCELFLYLADRAQHVEEVILPALAVRRSSCAIGSTILPLPIKPMAAILAKKKCANCAALPARGRA